MYKRKNTFIEELLAKVVLKLNLKKIKANPKGVCVIKDHKVCYIMINTKYVSREKLLRKIL